MSRKIIVLAFAGAWMALAPVTATASAFFSWQVADVPESELLFVRAYPSSSSRPQAAYPNKARLQMTGRCTDGVKLDIVNGEPATDQRQAVRHVWCEIWHNPTNRDDGWVNGWAYGKYIEPLR